MGQMRPELNNAIQSLSLNGYSVFSLIDDILACRSSEDKRIKLLQEGLERDAADICARLLCFDSVPKRVLKYGRVQCTCFVSLRVQVTPRLSYVHLDVLSQDSQTCNSD